MHKNPGQPILNSLHTAALGKNSKSDKPVIQWEDLARSFPIQKSIFNLPVTSPEKRNAGIEPSSLFHRVWETLPVFLLGQYKETKPLSTARPDFSLTEWAGLQMAGHHGFFKTLSRIYDGHICPELNQDLLAIFNYSGLGKAQIVRKLNKEISIRVHECIEEKVQEHNPPQSWPISAYTAGCLQGIFNFATYFAAIQVDMNDIESIMDRSFKEISSVSQDLGQSEGSTFCEFTIHILGAWGGAPNKP